MMKAGCIRFSRRHRLARSSKEMAGLFSELGVQAVIGCIRNTLAGPWLDSQEIEQG